ncbi:MAG: hypothetical protein ACYC0T_08700 [Ramlibacter sp.]
MHKTSEPSQLLLDFEQKQADVHEVVPVSLGKVIPVRFGQRQPSETKPEDLDSVLEDVLTNARRLSW